MVACDACSLSREAGAGTLRHPGTAIDDGAGWVVVLLVCVASAWAAAALLVEADSLAVPAVEFAEPELEEPHAARIIAAAAAVRASAAALVPPRGARPSRV